MQNGKNMNSQVWKPQWRKNDQEMRSFSEFGGFQANIN